MKNFCFVSSSRADYDLLYHLMLRVKYSKKYKFQLIITGSHLFKSSGMTIDKIIKDGFTINQRIKLSPKTNQKTIIRNISKGISKFTTAYDVLKPDIVILLGDRFEIFSSAISAYFLNIPIAHIHGGEVTLSAFDDTIRHSITKMSQLHFVSNTIYRNRVIQLGENPKSVFNVGSLGAERIRNINFLKKKKLEKIIGFNFKKRNILITYHPETLKLGQNENFFNQVLCALNQLNDTGLIFTSPNSDTDGHLIKKLIKQFIKKNKNHSILINSMGAEIYFSTMKLVTCVLGNSSSGISEAPLLNIPTINIGDRQSGRVKNKSVSDCVADEKTIIILINRLFAKNYKIQSKKINNDIKLMNTSYRILECLNKYKLSNHLMKKFYDLK